MLQKDLNSEKKEIKDKAYELYEKHGFKDGNDFVDWLEAEKQTGKLDAKRQAAKRSRAKRISQTKKFFLTIVGILLVIVLILVIMLFRRSSTIELSKKSLSDLKVMMLVLDPKNDEKVVVFGDTHFDYDQSTLSPEAKTLLDKDVQVLKENPKSAEGHLTKGRIYLLRGDGENAVVEFRNVVDEQPQSVPANLYLGQAHMVSGEYDLAIDMLNRALENDPTSRQVLRMLEKRV